MTKTEILDDLDYIKTLAEEGRSAPLLGGRFGLWWGILLCIALLVHWASLTGRSPLPIEMIGFVWLGFGIIGGIGWLILGRNLVGKPGAASVNNRINAALWTGIGILLFFYSLAAFLSVATGHNDFSIMDTILPLAFGLYALAAYVLAQVAQDKFQVIPGIIALAFVPLCLFLQGTSTLYLVAPIGILLSSIIPSIFELRREPKMVV